MWFWFSAGSLQCWVKARTMDEASRLGVRACLEAYGADVSHYYQCAEATRGPRRGEADRDEVIPGVWWPRQ